MLTEVQLTYGEDEIVWKWTANGVYTAKSAYHAQFVGTYYTFDANATWKAKAEGKHRIFTWLLVQQGMERWWNDALAGLPKNTKRQRATLMTYTAWNIWKERNRRVFENQCGTPQRVLALIKEVKMRSVACDAAEPFLVFQ
ncbi:hypothetical protein HU200_059634 [Digitaria exilis]|uniref:Reverse transcriptase zinc-binding domain-containing protein n=1 Tax=Digitaria exilis TaxID=1010633 RepID=A0A835E184_9POAL|nr:hypothetical protein HU200_059634 [Digitaria exilis]